jgi:hypothetical protein
MAANNPNVGVNDTPKIQNVPQNYSLLRTLKASNMNELVEDLNYNMTSLLNILTAKGLRGLPGTIGDLRPGGKRGSSFMFLNVPTFNANFEAPSDENDIILSTINAAIALNAVTFFRECLSFDDIVDNDLLILPNGDVIKYNTLLNQFESTYLKIYKSVNSLTTEQIIELIEMHSSTGTGLYTMFSTINKTVPDDNPNAAIINSALTANSIADIATLESGPGFASKSLNFVALQESMGYYDGNKSALMFMSGYAVDYHTLIPLKNSNVALS